MASPNVSTQNFDYIVIGSGTAGTTLAARLSEDPDIVVGVIEAGEHVTDMLAVAVPGMAAMLAGNEKIDWKFKSVPQPHADNRQISLPRGKAVGGSSVMNYMAWGRPTKEEYDAIEALGNPGWGWKGLLPYLMKAEGMIQPPEDLAKIYHTAGYTKDWHGQTGPIKKSFPHWYNDLHVPFLESTVKLGVPLNCNTGNGVNYGSFTGAFCVDAETATRSYAATGYYEPNAGRKNLVLISQAQATRIILKPAEDGELVATGVEYIKDGQKAVIKASREVIISAGASAVREAKNLADCHTQTDGMLAFSQEKQRGMLSSMFSAYAFVSLEKAYESKDKYDAFKRLLAADNSLGQNAAEKQEYEFIKRWLSEPERSHLESVPSVDAGTS
ncbi:hypothetical protein EWM64_g7588 [Hericium alpestre]|uniref:Glucose-methanol-choline oxidoreductase N-terminal domain-containing protein n=1 Tax=Hericium alpestre TaxID=135208 RepID=A0A4Y9ZQW8_9AGAM|nr:hypothetical protein EWM64_g7588 [Hericium alpestre]